MFKLTLDTNKILPVHALLVIFRLLLIGLVTQQKFHCVIIQSLKNSLHRVVLENIYWFPNYPADLDLEIPANVFRIAYTVT